MESTIKCIQHLSKNDAMTRDQLKRLADHKYSASDTSFLAVYMNVFWNWFVQLYPLWLAPNLITLLGLAFNIVAVLILAYYSPDGKNDAPRWAYFLCGLGLFVYQTLDATDGKQARRTGSSSPLGELFDHGCDSLSQIFICLETLLSLKMGYHPTMFIYVVLMAISVFYFAHWQTYVCGTLKFQKFDVTEAQFAIIVQCFITALLGPEIWAIEIFGWKLRILVLVVASLASFFQFYQYALSILNDGCGKNGTTVANTSVIFPLFPLLTVIVPGFVMFRKSGSDGFSENLVFYSLFLGLVGAKVTNRLIIAHMSRSELQLFDTILYGPLILFLNQYFDNFLPEFPLLIVCFIYCAINLFCYCVTVCVQMSQFMQIDVFRIKPVTSSPAPPVVKKSSRSSQ